MYLEDLVFCIKRAGWKVTKIHSRLIFEKNVGKDFYKLMSNSNFEYDCRNNIDNCKFVPIFDEYKETIFINR